MAEVLASKSVVVAFSKQNHSLLEVKLSHEPAVRSVGWSFGWNVY